MSSAEGKMYKINVCVSCLLTLAFGYFYMNINRWVIATLPSTISPAEFPTLITSILIIMSILLGAVSVFFLRRKTTLADSASEAECQIDECECDDAFGKKQFVSLLSYISTLLLYLTGLHYIGFVYSTPLVMLFVAKQLGLKKWPLAFVVYIIFTYVLNYVVFTFMHVILPSGVLFE